MQQGEVSAGRRFNSSVATRNRFFVRAVPDGSAIVPIRITIYDRGAYPHDPIIYCASAVFAPTTFTFKPPDDKSYTMVEYDAPDLVTKVLVQISREP